MKKKSTFLGSIVSVLLAFSVISYAGTYVQQQDPKTAQQTNQPNQPGQTSQTSQTSTQATSAVETSKSEAVVNRTTESLSATAPTAKSAESNKESAVTLLAENYTATAYSLRGRTASGRPVARGVIAADPRFLPIGTRVRVEAGAWTGEYVVADTGGSVRGRRIDIWTPTAREAMRFGKRLVKLTVLEFAGKRAKNKEARRLVDSSNYVPANPAPAPKQ